MLVIKLVNKLVNNVGYISWLKLVNNVGYKVG